jgi:L-2-hydroxyglutarate oxidase LhgO
MTFKECRGDLSHDNVANVKVQRLRVVHAKTKIRRGLHFLTTQTSITLLLAFSPSAIARPPTSVNLLAFCAMRRYA